MRHNEDEINILKEKDFILTSDKNIEYKLKLFINNNDSFCISAFTTKNIPSKKYSLSLTMNELIKNRFFKIFINIEEIFRELKNKIDKSTFIEDTKLIIIDIQIGLTVINEILLEIKEKEKNKTEMEIIINQLIKNNEELKNENNKLKEILKKELNIKDKEIEEIEKIFIDELKLESKKISK